MPERRPRGETATGRLASGTRPLLDTEPELQLTAHGHAVLRGDADWEGRPERWLGGIRLDAGPPPWRYDPALDRVVAG